jgi:ParB family chromosome partitioning protein
MNSADERQRKALGKGLSALLPVRRPEPGPAAATAPARPQSLPIDAIKPNPMQPRTTFREDRMRELADSIRAHGVIQAIIVRHAETGYQIVAGERRWRAARLAGLTEVPVIVQDVADTVMLEVALIENIQREDLNPIETAHAYERLSRELGLSQEEISRRTGKDRSSIANTIRLLKLPPEIQLYVAEGRLSAGHARAILGLHTDKDQRFLAEKVVAEGWSVREAEAYVQHGLLPGQRERQPKREPAAEPLDPNIRAAIETLEQALGTRVRIVATSDQRGRFELEYYSAAERDRLYNHLVSYHD